MRQDPQLILRVPADLRDRLRARAAANRRSMTGEMIVLLESFLKVPAAVEQPAHREPSHADPA